MSKFDKRSAATFLLLTTIIVFSGNPHCFAVPAGGEDACIKIAVDNHQRSNRLTDEFKSTLTPAPGSDFYILELKFEKIKCGYVFLNLTDMMANTYLSDSGSQVYQVIDGLLQGFQIEDPTDLTSSKAFAEGSILKIAFELPVSSTVSSIHLAYYHGTSWDDAADPQAGSIDIDLNGSPSVSDAQREALISLYYNTGGNDWLDNSGWKTPPVGTDGFGMPGSECDWYGVECSDGRVTHLLLQDNHLVGSIPPELGNLTGLQYLFLNDNQLTGNIPPEVGNLANLYDLVLDNNRLTGSIPNTIGQLTNLKQLSFTSNQLTGSIPKGIGKLTNLTYLSFYANQLSGSIPSELTNLSRLEKLYTCYNRLHTADSVVSAFITDLEPAWQSCQSDADGYDITSELWIKTVLHVPGATVCLIWNMVGADRTPSGDQVISGYFYADPKDFAYGSTYNPELFVKIFIATNGWCNIAFNHVTVDNVSVFSAHRYVGTADKEGLVSLNGRLAEHQYNGVAIDSGLQSSRWDAGNGGHSGYSITSGLWTKASLQPASGPLDLVWKEVGTDNTPSGDKVVSGYFYAAPDTFAYGSVYNPEVFVKAYIATNGWANMAFNHVTVDPVTVYSATDDHGSAEQTGSITLDRRLTEHQYNGVSLQ